MSDFVWLGYGLFAYALGIYVGYFGFAAPGREREKQLKHDFELEKWYTARLQRTNYNDYQTIRRLRRVIVRRNRVIRALVQLVPRRGKNGRFVKKVA